MKTATLITMQATTNETTCEEPRKLNIQVNESLSVAKLETVPLKKRLEILFISTIIPSRRQLAFKYGLDEELIHNVLSHRNYILQNWKYNANTECLLTKPELENAMAFMELLIEWKRRVLLNGLQMTQAALLRKTLALQKILKANKLKINDDWWQLFNENCEHKQFRDSENDSLEFEDILNDLQWMFTENAFKRLLVRLRCARSAGRTRIKREFIKDEPVDDSCLDDDEDDDELNKLLDISDIKAEPLYYNDDDFDCEDYEFVLDEELVLDSLRRELADAEMEKYQQYMGINTEFLYTSSEGAAAAPAAAVTVAVATTEQHIETAEYVEELETAKSENVDNDVVEEEETDNKTDIMLEELQQENNANVYTATQQIPLDSISDSDPLWSMLDRKVVPVPIRLDIVNNTVEVTQNADNTNAETQKIIPKPFRRKPRNMHGVVTVRKDCVRLPTTAEVANFATKKFLTQEIGEETNETDENNDDLQEQAPAQAQAPPKTRKRKYQKKAATTQNKASLNTSVVVFENIDQVHHDIGIDNEQPTIEAEASVDGDDVDVGNINDVDDHDDDEPLIKPSLQTSHETNIKMPLSSPKHDLAEFITILKSEVNTAPSTTTTTPTTTIATAATVKQTKNAINKNIQRAELKSNKKKFKTSNVGTKKVDGDFIISIPTNLNQSPSNEAVVVVVSNKSEVTTNQKLLGERRKQKFKDKLKTTSVQILDEPPPTASSSSLKNNNDDDDNDDGQAEVETNEEAVEKKSARQNINIKHLDSFKKSTQKIQTIKNSTVKRMKRRTDDSDLTLRRDKVRISLATSTVSNKFSQ